MPRYIDAYLLKCAALAVDKGTFTFGEVIDLIDAVKPADVREVKHGKWTTTRTLLHDGEWYCSNCDSELWYVFVNEAHSSLPSYCPTCGAKMEEEE